MIDLTSCYNLRELELEHISITDASFNLLISRVRLLEILKISHCSKLRMIKISLLRLKHLKLMGGTSLKAIEIDALLLSKFALTLISGSKNLPVLVLADFIPGSMYLNYDRVYRNTRVNSSWFLRIREYLGAPFKGKFMSLYATDYLSSFDPGELSFDHDELREALIPPLVEVDCLDLTNTRVNVEYLPHWNTLLDGLLWSCHPKMIRTKKTTYAGGVNNCLKALCEMLKESGCRLCCNLPRCKCWRRRLKAVKMVNMKGVEFPDFNAEGSCLIGIIQE